jgi:gliding motility-associated-like protein
MKFLLGFVFFLTAFFVSAQEEEIWMYPNEGQWESQIKYQVNLNNGKMYLEANRFTFHFYENILKHHQHTKEKSSNSTKTIHNHVIQHEFIGAQATKISANGKSEHYQNYFIGKDSSKWKSNIHGTQEITYSNFYPNIDLLIDTKNKTFEYAFSVAPNQDVSCIKSKILGANNVFIDKSGNLHYTHSFGEVIEQKLYAWTIDENGIKTPVPIEFNLENETVLSYYFPNGYNKKHRLLIDPELIFSTFTGSTSDNWGFTASPDEKGNLYAGGISFGIGYPTTVGAFDLSYNGGDTYLYTNNGASMTIPGIDISISKFNTDGSQLLYSTYLGGIANETPHSIIANSKNELYILGVTSSVDYPTSSNAYDTSFNKGGAFDNKELGFNGSDIIITKFSEDGTKLLGSTYLGGSNIDGLNDSELAYNYGDNFRGEIILDKNEQVILVSSTQSNDFPIKSAFQSQLNGKQDAVISKFNSNLSQLIWSSYFGGNLEDCGNSVQLNTAGEIFFTGGTSSSGLAFTNSYQGGPSDGYVVKLSSGTPKILTGLYVGTPEYDQSYFVQIDAEDGVYLFGQTQGVFAITPGKFGIPNSGQFIVKYKPNLEGLSWSTTIGAGSGNVEISPTAFSVSRCADIYITGWGGKVNVENSKATMSSAINFPITEDAFQKQTHGDNFYLGVLSKDAEKLKYGSYIGGLNTSYNHVDGGTSRFSKTGGIYHAVCGGCGGQINGFTTTPGVLSSTNKSSNCNLAAFKFELNKTKAIASISDSVACKGATIQFTNASFNANKYKWIFDKGSTSTQLSPKHTFLDTGTFIVKLIAIDSSGCMNPDTTEVKIKIEGGITKITEPNISTCPNSSIALSANQADSYHWEPRMLVIDSLAKATKSIELVSSQTFIVTEKKGCFSILRAFPVKIFPENITLTKNQEICRGNSVNLNVNAGDNISWSPATYLSSATGLSVTSTPDSSITYKVLITTQNKCSKKDSVTITVIQPDAKIIAKDSLKICQNSSLLLNFFHASNISISPAIWLTQNGSNTYTIRPNSAINYTLNYTNSCGNHQEKFHIDVHTPKMWVEKDTSICLGGKAQLACFGGTNYTWLNPENIRFLNGPAKVEVNPKSSIIYTVKCVDSFNCIDTNQVSVSVFPKPVVKTEYQYLVHWGEEITLKAQGNSVGKYHWTPNENLSCSDCQFPKVSPQKNQDYTVYYQDTNTCVDSATIHIIFESELYVPNTFTPNGQNGNDVFKAVGENITNFQLDIYNRWGENIISLNDINESWDGTYNGIPCKDGTYTWKLRYVDSFGLEHRKTGHINLIR